jgi:hypothetical protein
MDWIIGLLVLIIIFLLMRQTSSYAYPEGGCDPGMPFYQSGDCVGPRTNLAFQ